MSQRDNELLFAAVNAAALAAQKKVVDYALLAGIDQDEKLIRTFANEVRDAANAAGIRVLHNHYAQHDAPPVEGEQGQ